MQDFPVTREHAGRYLGFRSDGEWARGQVDRFPLSWAGRLLSRWGIDHRADRRAGNLGLLERCESLGAAWRAGIQADANDSELCQEASESARDMGRRLSLVVKMAQQAGERLLMLAQHLEAMHWLTGRGIADHYERHARRNIPAALKRTQCERWWRRVLRAIHARAAEGTARALGLVHKRAGCYVSDDAAARRRGQVARNAAALESVAAINEHGQEYTLAELAAKGAANKEIRRHELMTRIAGFELIARECGHEALFVTVTCPSRMHAVKTRGAGVADNDKFDGSTPSDGQRHLSAQWAKFRAAADRAGLELYGFRIAEPNHDGTPHWHALLFFPAVTAPKRGRARPGVRVAVRLLRRYFLWNVDQDEKGARAHRVKVERIDWTKGSAAGYVAKYVSKNIDGHRVERDLYGNDAMTSSQRVEAWAATWRIRQFQQVGGAPVGVWRELRRLHPEQGRQAEAIADGLEAVNVTANAERHQSEAVQRYTAANGWAAYLHLQGGHRVRRQDLRVQLLREQSGELGRYGELMAPRPVGVTTVDVRREQVPAFGIVRGYMRTRRVTVEVESERAAWLVVPKGFAEQARQRLRTTPARAEGMRPWSPVNNCTRPEILADRHPAALFAPEVQRATKLGRWVNWNGGASQKAQHDHGNHDPGSHHNHH